MAIKEFVVFIHGRRDEVLQMITKELRRQLSLPVTKDLVYYPNRFKNFTEKVTDIEIVEENNGWYSLCITTDAGSRAYIHSSYLKNMQSPSFVEDMAESDRNL